MIKTISIREYAEFLETLRNRVAVNRYKAARAVNKELILLYHYIGTEILKRQKQHGWGAKIIDRLSQDLGKSFPEMKGFSPRNLKYMRKFAEEYSEIEFVQEVLAQLTWYHNLTLLDKVRDHLDIGEQDFYLDLLFYHLKLRCYIVIELKDKGFKPEYAGKMNFYLSAVDDLVKHPSDNPSIGLILCKSKNEVLAEHLLQEPTQEW